MAEAVISEHEVSIQGVRYPMLGSVQRGLSSNYPPKLVTGDYTKDSSPILSTLALSDHRGGIGLDNMEGQGDTDRSWYSTADIRYKRRLILPQLTTTTAGLPSLPGGAGVFGPMVEFKSEVYAYIDGDTSPGVGDIYKYDGTSSWGSALLSSINTPGDAVSGDIGGTRYIFYCNGPSYYYSSNGTAWTTVTPTLGAVRMVIWDNKLWGMSSTGQLWYVTTPGGTQVSDATLALRNQAELGNLYVGRDASGEQVIYVATTFGLLVHDFDNGRFIATELATPNKEKTGTTAYSAGAFWRGRHYFSAETTLLEYDPSAGLVKPIGPDRDGGIPSGYGTVITGIAPSLNELIVAVNGSGTQKGLLLAWDGRGWRVLAELATSELFTARQKSTIVAGAYADYRAWFSSDEGNYIKYTKLPSDLVNPLRLTTYTYAAAATHDWPWFTAGQSEVSKVAVRVKAETLNPTTDETVIISYATDWSESFTALATITTAGVTTFALPNSTTPTGISFKSIRFRAALARGSTNTNTPQVIALTLEYYKKLDPKYQFNVTLDLTKDYKNNTVKGMRAALLTAMETATLVEFTYRDPSSNSDATFYVQVRPQVSTEFSGNDERGTTQLLLVEV